MSQPLDNIKKAIDEHSQPLEERRPHWFADMEEYDGPTTARQDPATGEDVTGGVKGKPKSNQKGGG